MQNNSSSNIRGDKNDGLALHIRANLSCLLQPWRWVCYTRRLLLGFWVILLNTCLITYDHIQKFWTSLKSLLTALAYADMILLLLFTWQVEQNWLPVWYVFRLSSEMLQMKFPTCKEFQRQWFLCFQEEVPSFNSDFHLFCPSMKQMTSSTISELGILICSPKATCNISKFSTAFFSILSRKWLGRFTYFQW